MSYPAISLSTATADRHRRPQKRLRPPANLPSTRIRTRIIAPATPSPLFRCPHALHPGPSVDSDLGATVRFFLCTWKAVLGRRLASPICAFHLGISLGGPTNAVATFRATIPPAQRRRGRHCLRSLAASKASVSVSLTHALISMPRRCASALISLFKSGSIFTVIRVVIAVFLQLCQGVGTMQQLSPVRDHTSLRCAIQLEYL